MAATRQILTPKSVFSVAVASPRYRLPPAWRCPVRLRTIHSSRNLRAATVASLLAEQCNDQTSGEREATRVEVNGRVRSIRKQKTRAFALIGDATSLEPLQAVLTPQQAENLSTGAGVQFRGLWTARPNQPHLNELHVESVNISADVESATYPMQKKTQNQGHTVEFLRTIPHMRTRHHFTQLLIHFVSKCEFLFSQYFDQQGFARVHTPILTSSDCEAGGETFSVRGPITKEDDGTFFRFPKYLTVSHQLELEALAQSNEKVWGLSPTFRAERSDTARHLSEFYMLEVEQTHIQDKNEVMDLLEDLLRTTTEKLYKSKWGHDIINGRRSESPVQTEEAKNLSHLLEGRWQGIMRPRWPRITYENAIAILSRSPNTFENKPEWNEGLTSEHENYIATYVGKGSPVFVTNYPKSIKPFYMSTSPPKPFQSGEVVENFDLLVPGVCELAGGSMREDNLMALVTNMREKGLLPYSDCQELTQEELGNYKEYTDLRRWGYVPSGGFGLGYDRLIMYLTGIQNIRDVVLYPRSFGH